MHDIMETRVELYRSKDGSAAVAVRTDGDTVWLTRQQLAALFGRDVKTIGKHVNNALREELQGMSVVAKYATTAADGKTYEVDHYNLDLVLSVGYRVKSPEGVHFRRWASDVLNGYLTTGAAINRRRLDELGRVARILERADDRLVAGVGEIVAAYLPGLRTLRDYDDGVIEPPTGDLPTWQLDYAEACEVIAGVADRFPDDLLLGMERDGALQGVIGSVYQTFGGHDLYPSLQSKAAHLLYLIVKDHPLADGNKRSAAALFVHFLARNDALHDPDGHSRVSNSALAAITLMVAMSDPREKDLMVDLVTSMLA